MENKYRGRKHCLLLYPNEDESHRKAIEYIKLNYDYALIVHDKDFSNDTGEIKKAHTHIVLSCDNAKWNTALATELGITPNYIQQCRNYENALNYLIHYNDDTKYQYSINEVKGNLKQKLEKLLINDKKDENDKSIELIEYIKNYEGVLSVSRFAKYSAEIGMWDVFRRASFIFLKLIEEHNFSYKTKGNATSYNTYYVNFYLFFICKSN